MSPASPQHVTCQTLPEQSPGSPATAQRCESTRFALQVKTLYSSTCHDARYGRKMVRTHNHAEIGLLHIGHATARLKSMADTAHLSMHSRWKRWLHGSRLSTAPGT